MNINSLYQSHLFQLLREEYRGIYFPFSQDLLKHGSKSKKIEKSFIIPTLNTSIKY